MTDPKEVDTMEIVTPEVGGAVDVDACDLTTIESAMPVVSRGDVAETSDG